ncbi:MAG: tetratricopeptide repeat protein [Acidobacteria bacterium]|nr:tetratricopeptide repeat protein [Acidobacteriota bacterium]
MSYELLSEEQQERWRMLAIFPTDFDVPAAAVWRTDVDAAKDSLAEFEEYSLLDWEEATRRFTLHDLARDYADTHLSTTERERAGLLHAAYYLQILSTADDLFLKGGEAIAGGLSLFDNERANIEAGQEWAATRFADDEQAARLCNRYPGVGVYVLSLRQHPRDFIRWHEAALLAARQLKDHAAEGRHLGNLGLAYADLGETRRAIEFFEQHRDIAREIGDRRGEGNALGNLGSAYANLGETERAVECMEAAVKIFEEIESPNANVVRDWLEKLRGKSG